MLSGLYLQKVQGGDLLMPTLKKFLVIKDSHVKGSEVNVLKIRVIYETNECERSGNVR